MRKFFRDFKQFISRGNIVDLAVAVIIGNAFGKIVTSLVDDIIMPLITWALGASSLADLSVPLKWKYVLDPTTGETVRQVTLAWKYGNFLQTIIDFLIIAFCIFCVLKLVMKSQELFKNTAHSIEKSIEESTPTKAEKVILKERGVNLKDREAVKVALNEIRAEEEAKRLEEEEKKKAEEANKPKEETEIEILKEMRELMRMCQQKTKVEDVSKVEDKGKIE